MQPSLNRIYTDTNFKYLRKKKSITEAEILEIFDELEPCRNAKGDENAQIRFDANFLSLKICNNHQDKIPEKFSIYKDKQQLLTAFKTLKDSEHLKLKHDKVYVTDAIEELSTGLTVSKVASQLGDVGLQPSITKKFVRG